MTQSRTLIGLAAALLLAGAAWADDASKTAKADELLQITKGDQTYKPILAGAQSLLKRQAFLKEPAGVDKAAFEQQVSQAVSEEVNWDKLRPQFVKAYADTFTEAELDGILAFYKSPAGQAWEAKSTDLTTAAVNVSKQAIQEAQARIRKITDEAAAPK